MGLLSLFRKDKPEEKVEIDVASTKVPVEGHGDVTLQEMINSYRASHANKLDDGDLIDVDGKKIPLRELRNAFLHNAESDKLEKEHKDGEHKDNAKKNCGMCNAAVHEPTNLKEKASELPKVYNAEEEEKKKKDEEAKNAADEEKKKEEEEKPLEFSTKRFCKDR